MIKRHTYSIKNYSRKEKEEKWAKNVILESAASVFAAKGYHGATIEEIAAQAGYSPAAIYKYFDSKQDVFLAHLESIKQRIFGIFTEEPPVSLDFSDKLRWVLHKLFAVAEENRGILVSFLTHPSCMMFPDRSKVQIEIRNFYDMARESITKLMKKGIEEGKLKNCNPHDLSSAFLGLLHAFVFRWLMQEKNHPLKEYIENVIDFFFNGAATVKGHGNDENILETSVEDKKDFSEKTHFQSNRKLQGEKGG